MSQQIGQLERQAGARLLERVGRNVRLTPAAHVLVGHADAVPARLEQQKPTSVTAVRPGSRRHPHLIAVGAALATAVRTVEPACPSGRLRPALARRLRAGEGPGSAC